MPYWIPRKTHSGPPTRSTAKDSPFGHCGGGFAACCKAFIPASPSMSPTRSSARPGRIVRLLVEMLEPYKGRLTTHAGSQHVVLTLAFLHGATSGACRAAV